MSAKFTRNLFLLAVLVMFGLLAAGCYTVLVHPQVQATGEATPTKTCSDCHASADYYYWHFPYQYGWYSSSPWWGHYYRDPWWWNDYWYWHDDDHGHGGASIETGERHNWQPTTRPPTTPAIAPGSSSSASDYGKSSGGSEGGSDNKPPQVKQEEPKRHFWQPYTRPSSGTQEKAKTTDANSEQKKADDKNEK